MIIPKECQECRKNMINPNLKSPQTSQEKKIELHTKVSIDAYDKGIEIGKAQEKKRFEKLIDDLDFLDIIEYRINNILAEQRIKKLLKQALKGKVEE